jgi:mannose-6-phosphate isomerase-like protein (cupin superfamily)
MVIQRSEMKSEQKEKVQNGEGILSHTHLVDCKDEKNVKMLAELTLPPGASIGYHKHDSETEYYLIVSGTGLVNDNGRDVTVKAGDAIITGDGASHSIKNSGAVPLVFHALIVTH